MPRMPRLPAALAARHRHFWGPNELRIVKRRIEFGILYSRSGNYRLISESCRSGAIAAIADVNADPAMPDRTRSGRARSRRATSIATPPGCEDILRQQRRAPYHRLHHLVEPQGSHSRCSRNAGGTLWYACPYEGFEANEHVVYTACLPEPASGAAARLCRAALRRATAS